MSTISGLTVELDDGTRAALANTAREMGRDEGSIVREALEQYVALQAWQREHIEAALAATDAGEFATDEEVAACFARNGARGD